MENNRIAIVDVTKCQSKTCNYLCKRLCPGVKMGDETITINEVKKVPIIDEQLCTGCGICKNRCPLHAIDIININFDKSKPIHQYGDNQFRLFGLPLPEKGVINGIVGRNSVGKTSAINILSGKLIANFGKYKEEATMEKVIEYYRTQNIQKHFINLNQKKTKVAYKIQNVEQIPLMFKEKIIDLFYKTNNNEEKIKQVIEELNLKDIVNKKINEISGGELQKVAIGATLLKDAQLYFFDEFTTFLDIKQRFNVAKLLRKKIDEEKAYLVVEHDLAIMDYLCDIVQIMYGRKNAYGMCSGKKSIRKGINEFLNGFLKEENMRIREHNIVFMNIKENKSNYQENYIEYPNIEKQLGNFKLNIKKANVKTNEVVGILGSNAIGKTTFIKILAGEIKADNCEINLKLRVSYKAQYINYDEDYYVRDIFSSKHINKELFESEIKRNLDIEELYDFKISELSGGQLQRVAIGECLSKDADIYLIDEPSAYLDVEQRIVIANVIKNIILKNNKAAFVVDHDLLFLDYISDRILLFEGEAGKHGIANEIMNIQEAYNLFLKTQNITFRQDPETKRPRANKEGSQKDELQKKENKYYFVI